MQWPREAQLTDVARPGRRLPAKILEGWAERVLDVLRMCECASVRQIVSQRFCATVRLAVNECSFPAGRAAFCRVACLNMCSFSGASGCLLQGVLVLATMRIKSCEEFNSRGV